MTSQINKNVAGLVLGAIVLGAIARADEWDLGSDPDGGPTTDNALFHGSEQIHDLGIQTGQNPDEDWYLVTVRPFSSYQFIVDSFTGDLDLVSTGLQRVSEGLVVQENGVVLEGGGTLSMSWFRGGGTTDETNYVRVRGAACGTSCNTFDTYRSRFYETTYTVPRFNNSGSQATVLLIQNATDRACSLTMFFMDNIGVAVATSTSSLGPWSLLVFPTAGVAANQSGSVRIAHTCGYGGLSGKAVSVEPATGFTFDTAVLHRPH